MDPSNPLSLQNHCATCQTKCCNGFVVTALEHEHEKIIAAGHADHFEELPVEGKNYYILNFFGKNCEYLTDQGCSIEDVKPIACQIYPAQAIVDEHNNIIHAELSKACPASSFLDDSFIIKATKLIQQRWEEFPPTLRKKVSRERFHKFGL